MSTRWVFIRHGESQANAEGWLSGHEDVPLTELGRQQAGALPAVLANLAPLRVVASDLQRAYKTAELGAPEHEVTQLRGLRERSVGDWQGVQVRALRQDGRLGILLTWTGAAPAGESQRDVARRVVAELARLDPGHGTVAVVVHGGVIRCVLGMIDGTEVASIGYRKVHNTEVFVRVLPHGDFGRMCADPRLEG